MFDAGCHELAPESRRASLAIEARRESVWQFATSRVRAMSPSAPDLDDVDVVVIGTGLRESIAAAILAWVSAGLLICRLRALKPGENAESPPAMRRPASPSCRWTLPPRTAASGRP